MASSEPLIYTIKGNLPVSALAHEVEWKITPEQIVFIERYRIGDEVVRQSAHVKLLLGATADGAASM